MALSWPKRLNNSHSRPKQKKNPHQTTNRGENNSPDLNTETTGNTQPEIEEVIRLSAWAGKTYTQTTKSVWKHTPTVEIVNGSFTGKSWMAENDSPACCVRKIMKNPSLCVRRIMKNPSLCVRRKERPSLRVDGKNGGMGEWSCLPPCPREARVR